MEAYSAALFLPTRSTTFPALPGGAASPLRECEETNHSNANPGKERGWVVSEILIFGCPLGMPLYCLILSEGVLSSGI